MGCRCGDISRLENEINKLEGALSCTEQAEVSSEMTKTNMKSAGCYVEIGTILILEQFRIAGALRKKYDISIQGIQQASIGVGQAITQAENELSAAISEDTYFHEID